MLARRILFAAGAMAITVSTVSAMSAACSFDGDEPAADLPAEGGAESDPGVAEGGAEAAGEEAGTPAVKPEGTVLATGFKGLAGVAATESTVYVVERERGAVHAVPLAGGQSAEISNVAGSQPSAIVVSGANVYWSDRTSNALHQLTLEGVAGPTAPPAAGKRPVALHASSEGVVVVALGANDIGEIQQYGFDFTPGPTVADFTQPFDVAVSGADLYWTESGGGGAIWKGTIGAGAKDQLVPGEALCQSLAADPLGVYWATQGGKVRARLANANANVTLGNSESKPMSLASDASGVYWLTGDGRLRRSSRAAELPPTTLSKGFASAFDDPRVQAIALTASYVVWITSDGTLLRLPK